MCHSGPQSIGHVSSKVHPTNVNSILRCHTESQRQVDILSICQGGCARQVVFWGRGWRSWGRLSHVFAITTVELRGTNLTSAEAWISRREITTFDSRFVPPAGMPRTS